MGRPRAHEHAREALRTAAAQLVERHGPDGLSVRGVASSVGTTTRAIYSVFESKDGLVSSVAQRGYEELSARLDRLPETADPVADLVEVGATAFRSFVAEHPALFRLAFQRMVPAVHATPALNAARAAVFAKLEATIRRVYDAGLLGDHSVLEAAVTFTAMCEGLGNADLRGGTLRVGGDPATPWRAALGTLIAGFTAMPAVGLAGVEPATSTL